MATKTIDRVDIDFEHVNRRALLDKVRRIQIQSSPVHMRTGLQRYLQAHDHYLALNSRTPSQLSGAPSSIS